MINLLNAVTLFSIHVKSRQLGFFFSTKTKAGAAKVNIRENLSFLSCSPISQSGQKGFSGVHLIVGGKIYHITAS